MAKELPRRETRRLLQYNRSDVLGDIDSSFNIDQSTNEGAIRNTRMKLVSDSTTITNLENVVSIVKFDGKFHALSEDVFIGGDFPSDSFAEDVASGNPGVTETVSDMDVFNGKLYVSDPGASTLTIKTKSTSGGTWSVADTASINGKELALLEPYADNLYVTANNVQVFSMSKAEVLVGSGTATLDLGLPTGWVITMLKAGNDRLWIGLLNSEGKGGLVYEWDGQSENTPSRSYALEEGVVAGVIKDNLPYVMTTNGKLMAFTGSAFKEVARLPIEDFPLNDNLSEGNIRWIHPNGMDVIDDDIIMMITNEVEGSTPIQNPNLPSGIWNYNPTTGLTHRYSISTSAVGGTTFSDYGQINLQSQGIAGALLYQKNEGSTTENGKILVGARLQDGTFGIFCDDTLDTTQKWGYFTTSKMIADQIEDKWSKIYAVYNKFLDSSDKIVIKYKTQDDTPIEAVATWTDTDTFTTTTDISAYLEGDEVQVTYGTGSGKSAHISSISEAGGTYTVNLDDTFTGATGTSGIRLEKWIKTETITGDNAEKQWNALTINKQNVSPWIKFKVCMQFTGKDELYKLRVINTPEVNQ